MPWILLSLLAALCYALRFVVVKQRLQGMESSIIVLCSRGMGTLLVVPLVCFAPIKDVTSPLLWGTIVTTALLTVVASLMQIHAVKRYDLSSSLPFLAFVPLFMVLSVYLIFQETPKHEAFYGVLLLCGGALVINGKQKSTRGSHLFFVVAVIYGLTTTLDRLAIDTAGGGGVGYSFLWNAFSTVLFLPLIMAGNKRQQRRQQIVTNIGPLLLQSILGIVAFTAQMVAVDLARSVTANVIYVKALTLLQLLFGAMFGIVLFNEGQARRRLLAASVMIVGAVVIALFGGK
jgi:drug/metabolite transporter (DMT)-like permease